MRKKKNNNKAAGTPFKIPAETHEGQNQDLCFAYLLIFNSFIFIAYFF